MSDGQRSEQQAQQLSQRRRRGRRFRSNQAQPTTARRDRATSRRNAGEKPQRPVQNGKNDTPPSHNQNQVAQTSQQEPHNQRNKRSKPKLNTAAIEHAPYVALSIQSSGIHPSTSKLVSIDAVTFTKDGEQVEQFHVVLNSGSDAGPYHLHGLREDEIAQGKRFGEVLKRVDKLIDGRVLLVHNAPRVWGFIVSEARRAMAEAARANRQRGRQKRRQRVGHVPQPKEIVDTLASARRQGLQFADTRVLNVARELGLEAPDAKANMARTKLSEAETSREQTLMIARMFFVQRAWQILAVHNPEDLRADKFGLQRSDLRIDATHMPREFENPGVYTPERGLVQGMEVVVAPEIAMDPDRIIEAAVRENLAYNEKLTRQTSVVVCNKREDLVGKAMHGDRKGIPLLSDEEFLRACEQVAPGKRLKD
ncbi:DNA polymerase III subunit epsilon [Corynebacterium gerontici]|uniref:DNA polymerase III subunit epsilon n=1 Tax=Corynebacterium gerontici TaxID=2079234 RepID=A0A3G6J8H5_9CORY|nr:DNA polymerase III subunit epsilon [Corynebacterium gerontici]AZA12324.1 DNA polymerase III subunit epsilon [Corynebacterium gerontici]